MTLGVALLKIPVSNLAASVRFYERALGLQAKVVVEDYGWAQLDGATVALALYVPGRGGGDRLAGGSVDFHLSTNRLGALLEQALRVAKDAAMHENADGSQSLEFTDPDGNVVKVTGRQ
jgi:catechol 2,3-dioxygenase-like lactoylglutathione lyase family enzyme